MADYIKLSKIANISTGFPFKGELYSDKGIRVIRGENVTIGSLRWDSIKCWDLDFNQAEKYTLQKGDVVIGMDGSRVGKNRAQIKESDLPLLLAQRVACLRSNNLSDQDFLYYIIRDERFERYVNKTQTGSSIPHISQQQIEDFYVPNHPLEDQRRIASVLSVLDAKIDLNNRINAELERMAKTLYNYWFVQFDFPNSEGKPYKRSGGKMVWSEELKREIPEGWKVENILRVSDLLGGGTPNTKNPSYWGNEIPFFTPKDTENSFFVVDTLQYITEEGLNNCSTRLFPKGTVFVTARGTVGNVNIASQPMAMNQSCYALKAKETINYQFLYLCVCDVVKQLKSKANGSVFDAIVSNDFRLTSITIPKLNLVHEFGTCTESLYEKILNNRLENQRLSALRDWLLPMLMNGQVTVGSVSQPKAEKQTVSQPESLFIPDNKKAFAKQVLGGKIVSLFQNDPHFSSIKFQKIQYLAEHVAEVDLNWNYYYQAAGPYDNVYMHTIMDKLKTANWFEKRDSKYVSLDKQEQIDRYYQSFFNPVAHRLDHLFSLLANMTDIDAEIIATLYAVWNNRLILNQPVSEELLIEDFYNWSDRKLLYTEEQLQKGLQWMRTNNIIPNGFGKEMKRAREKVKTRKTALTT